MLVVRAGNPKNIKDWEDLIRPDVKVITPNPKTSGGARWNYLAAWEFAKRQYGGDAQAQAYLEFLYTEKAQDLIGKHFYRPRSVKAQAKYAKQLPKLNLFTIDEAFGGWDKATQVHFVEGGKFDQIFSQR